MISAHGDVRILPGRRGPSVRCVSVTSTDAECARAVAVFVGVALVETVCGRSMVCMHPRRAGKLGSGRVVGRLSTVRTSVLLLGESLIMAAGLRQVLDATEKFTVVAACGSDDEARTVVLNQKVELVIMDLHDPVHERIALLREIKLDRPTVRVVVITRLLNATETAAMVMAGADGLLDAGITPDALVAVLGLLEDGVRFVTSHSLWPAILQALTIHEEKEADRGRSLTRRENDVFELLRDGLTDREISEVLTLSIWTVKHHVVNILQKLDMNSRREASRSRSRSLPLKGPPFPV